MRIEIHGTDLPGRRCGVHDNIAVGIQRKQEVVDLHAGDEPAVRWSLDVETRQDGNGAVDPRGPYVHGGPGKRFLYLSWGTIGDGGAFTMFSRAKLLFSDIDPSLITAAQDSGRCLQASLSLTGRDGGPRCGSVRPPHIVWTVSPTEPAPQPPD